MKNLLLTLIMFSGLLFAVEANSVAYFPPPLKQISNGIAPENVTCIEGLSLVTKTANNSPACVKHSSIEILIQRGWAVMHTEHTVNIIESSIGTDNNKIDSLKAQSIWDHILQQEEIDFEGKYIEGPTEDGYEITKYAVIGSTIVEKQSTSILPNELIHLQQDKEKHQEIWDTFASLIPEEHRKISVFYLTTDGVGEIGGGVNRDLDDLSKWHLFYDIYDSYPDGSFDEKTTIATTVHEFGHILTTSSNQLDVNSELVELLVDDDFDEIMLDELVATKAEECYPKYMSSDGCAKTNSYINQFYKQFWTDIVSEWDEIQYIENEDEYYEQSDIFYEKYQDQFATRYASANVDEDIAESWTSFVLTAKPEKDNSRISDQKVLFFYDYLELIELREYIRNNL